MIGQVTPDKVKAFFVPKRIPLIGDIPFIGEIFFNQDVFVYFGYIVTVLLDLYIYIKLQGLKYHGSW